VEFLTHDQPFTQHFCSNLHSPVCRLRAQDCMPEWSRRSGRSSPTSWDWKSPTLQTNLRLPRIWGPTRSTAWTSPYQSADEGQRPPVKEEISYGVHAGKSLRRSRSPQKGKIRFKCMTVLNRLTVLQNLCLLYSAVSTQHSARKHFVLKEFSKVGMVTWVVH